MDISTNLLDYSIIACQVSGILLMFFWIWKYTCTYLRGNPRNEFLVIVGLLLFSLVLTALKYIL